MPSACSKCGSYDLSFGNVQWDSDAEQWYQVMKCGKCGHEEEVEY